MSPSFQILATVAAIICFALTIVWLPAPHAYR